MCVNALKLTFVQSRLSIGCVMRPEFMRAKYGSSLIPNDSVFLWMVVVVDFF